MSFGYGDQTPPRKRQRGDDPDRDPPTPEKVIEPEKDDLIQRALIAIQLLTNVLAPNFGDDLAPFLADVLVLDHNPYAILPMIQFMTDMSADDVFNYLDDLDCHGQSPSRHIAMHICAAIAQDCSGD